MEKIENQKTKLKEILHTGEFVPAELREAVYKIPDGSSILELGGIGFIAEEMSVGNSVTLCDEQRLTFSYRKAILPNSTVEYMNIDPLRLNFSQPVFDYVIINDVRYLPIARKLAIHGIVNTVSQEFINVVRPPKAD